LTPSARPPNIRTMAKRKKRAPAPSKKTHPASGFSPALAGAIGLILGAVLTWGLRAPVPGERPPPPTEAAPGNPGQPAGGGPDLSELTFEQQQALAMQNAQVDQILQDMENNPGRLPAEDEDRRFLYRLEDPGRWLLITGRARAEKLTAWTAAVLRDGPDSLTGEPPEQGLAVEAVFTLPAAKSIETGAFAKTGSVAIVLTRKQNRGQGPGTLVRLVPGEGHGQVIDQDVFRFALAGDGDALLYEKAADPAELLGERELRIYHASRSEAKTVRTFAFPQEQIGDLGPWDPSGVFVNLSIETYEEGSFEPVVERYKLDGFNPTQLVPIED